MFTVRNHRPYESNLNYTSRCNKVVWRVVRSTCCLLKALRVGVAAVSGWHGKVLENVAKVTCVVGYSRLSNGGRRLIE